MAFFCKQTAVLVVRINNIRSLCNYTVLTAQRLLTLGMLYVCQWKFPIWDFRLYSRHCLSLFFTLI